METVTDFIFLGSKITADGDCSHEMKRCLLLERKAMTNLDSILKSRDIINLTISVYHYQLWLYQYSQSYDFFSSHIWMWELDHKESWAPKNWCLWTVAVVLEKTLESPLDYTEINQSILKEISTKYSLGGPMLKLKPQYFGHLMWRTDSLAKTLMLRKIEGRRRRGQQRMRWMDGITDWMDKSWTSSRSWWRTGKPGVL